MTDWKRDVLFGSTVTQRYVPEGGGDQNVKLTGPLR